MEKGLTILQALPGFIDYMTVERRFTRATVEKYRSNIIQIARELGDLPIEEIALAQLIALKASMKTRGAHESRIASVVFALKCLLVYARDVLRVQVLNLQAIHAPRSPRREVQYLSTEELNRFIAAIPLESPWTRRPRFAGYCFRTLVETLLATGMRISEALALNRDSIDFGKREARVVGKGNKERTVFFTPRALDWVSRLLILRTDTSAALFTTSKGVTLQIGSVEAMFRRTAKRTGIEKQITPHLLRHTAATHLLHRGCPIGYIKEILGHERLETTCHFYLGVLKKDDTKRVFDSYMKYDLPGNTAQQDVVH